MTARYRVEYLPAAERDLLDILDYIARDRPVAARAFVDRLERAIGRLAQFPRAGRLPSDDRLRRPGYRILFVGNDLVFSVLTRRTVEIRRVVHGARRYEFLMPKD